jgi:hypothetical protein
VDEAALATEGSQRVDEGEEGLLGDVLGGRAPLRGGAQDAADHAVDGGRHPFEHPARGPGVAGRRCRDQIAEAVVGHGRMEGDDHDRTLPSGAGGEKGSPPGDLFHFPSLGAGIGKMIGR